MNVQCPSCETVFRVDPAKVPAGGVRTQCTVCSNEIDIRPSAEDGGGAGGAASPTREARRTSAPRRAVQSAPAPEPEAPKAEAHPPAPAQAEQGAPHAAGPLISRPMAAPVRSPSEPRAPQRPSAPVFRAAPGKPMPAPPVPPPAATVPPTTQPINPFLTQDPQQKARRLARALVSDMIVYQPDKRQQALKAGNLRDAFEEEIKKSWEQYVEQVGEELANSTPYFTDALNEILAGGEAMF